MAQLVKNRLQCGRPGFDPWVGKIPWRRERLPTPVFWPAEFHGLYSPWGCKESDMTEWLKILGLPLWLSWQRIHLQCGRPGFYPWVGKIPWRRERLLTPVLLPGEFHGQRSLAGSIGSHRVRHNWSDLACMHIGILKRSTLVVWGELSIKILSIWKRLFFQELLFYMGLPSQLSW